MTSTSIKTEPAKHASHAAAPGRVILIDDDGPVLRSMGRILASTGLALELFDDARKALLRIEQGGCDLVVSDINMPELDGLELLRAVRARDLFLPVILVTGNASVSTAVEALNQGALRYLDKPVDSAVLRDAVMKAVQQKRDGMPGLTAHAGADASMERALGSLWMAYQPIVDAVTGLRYGCEALVRTGEPPLSNPGTLFAAGEQIGRLTDIGRTIRMHVAATIPTLPPTDQVFVNLHPRDLLDDELFAPSAPLSAHAHRVVLEITERAALDEVDQLGERVAELRQMGYRIAVDDLGAGYAGLSSLAELNPEVVKLDMSLVRDVDQSPVKQRLIVSLVSACRDLGSLVVAEGVETAGERNTVVSLGCDLVQGYLTGRPERLSTPVLHAVK
ncbi:MAG: EAL domain-containing protein [Polyangia bacterium]|jgi:EAL domain-containing protein (putative c-di-GMP-specific phosphodiesterase class I)